MFQLRSLSLIPRYNPDILKDVMDDESDSEDEDYTSGKRESKYTKDKGQRQSREIRHVDVIRNIQSDRKRHPRDGMPPPKINNYNNDGHYRTDPYSKSNQNGLHRTPMNGDAVLANHMVLNNGAFYQERHPLGLSQTNGDKPLNNNTLEKGSDYYTQHGQTPTQQRSNSRKRHNERRERVKRKKSRRNTLITMVTIVTIIVVVGAGIAAYVFCKYS